MVVGSLSILFYTQISAAEESSTVTPTQTERAATKVDGEDHSGQSRAFLICDGGVATTGVQMCQLYLQVIAGVKGVISNATNSKIALSAGTAPSATVYGTSKSYTASFAEGDSITSTIVDLPTGSTTFPHSTITLATGVTLDPFNTGLTDYSATQGDSDAQEDLAGDLCREFKGDDDADAHHSGGVYTSIAGSNIEDWLDGDSDNSALFMLQGFATGSLDRDANFGYATQFTIPYTITVTSNTATADASGGESC